MACHPFFLPRREHIRFLILLLISGPIILGAAADESQSLGQITILVEDGTHLLVPGALVEVDGKRGALRSKTDPKGSYSASQLAFGKYKITVRAPGFYSVEEQLELNAGQPNQRLLLILRLMEHREQIEVKDSNRSDGSRGLGSQVLGSREISLLPDDPDQLRARLQLLAAATGGSSGSAAVQVDGFLTQSAVPSKSAIREIRINPDLYSAQYPNQPIFGGGLIEIDTKPALDAIHGGFGWTWNNAALNARDSLALSRAPLSKNVGSGDISIPLIKHRLSSYTSIENKLLNEYAVVNAETLGSDLTPRRTIENVATPQRFFSAMERFDWQLTPLHALALRLTHQSNKIDHFGVGELTLPSASSLQYSQRTEVQLSVTSTFSQSSLNEARLGSSVGKVWLTPYSDSPAVSVAGGFLSGGSGSQYSTDSRRSLELNDTLSWALPKHTVRAGFQSLRFRVDQHQGNQFNGQLLFTGGFVGSNGMYLSGLDQYRAWLLNSPGVTPTVDQHTQGILNFGLTQWQTSLFVQDEWHATPQLSLSTGLRYESQTNPDDYRSLAPRFGLAYSFGKSSEWVARFRAGVFYRRVEPAVALENLRLSEGHQSDVLQYGLFTIVANRLPFAQSIKPALSVQPQLTLERRLKGGTSVQAGYTQLYSTRLLHSASTLDPVSLAFSQNRLSYQSNGESRGSVALVSVNSSAIRNLTFFSGYLFMHLRTNADNPNLFPESEDSRALEWAMPASQSRHRLYAGGFLTLPGKVELTFLSALIAGNSFDITTGRDNNGDGIFNDRPSLVAAGSADGISTPYGRLDPFAINGNLPRNAGRFPASLIVDSSLSRRFALGKADAASRSATISLRGTNLTNHFNPSSIDGVVGSPLFLQPTAADPSRRVELGVRLSF